jgi:DNA mismatch repair protein MutS
MLQHAAAKTAHPDCIVFFRLGDFYEMFGDDAVLAAAELGLVLTSRNKGKPGEIPMAGVPHHAAHGYIARLLGKGHKVAICEQLVDPATVRGIVPRDVVRVITPGTWTEADQLGERENSWLCSIVLPPGGAGGIGLALLDLTTAELLVAALADSAELLAEVSRAAPREILLWSEGADDAELAPSVRSALAEVARGVPVRVEHGPLLEGDQALLPGVDVTGAPPLGRLAAERALGYARACYKERQFPVWRLGLLRASAAVGIDRATTQHLDLVTSSSDDPSACLLSVIDQTSSPAGARLLRRRLLAPLVDVAAIRRRQDQVQALLEAAGLRRPLGSALAEVGDLERIVVRVSLAEANPRDLGLLRRGLQAAANVAGLLGGLDTDSRQVLGLPTRADLVPELCEHLARALVERPLAQPKDGATFVASYDAELGRLAELRTSGSEAMVALEAALRERTGIGSLRVRFTRVFGWYVEVSRSQQGKVPADWRRKQTVAGGERFTLPELDDLSAEILGAEERYRAREQELLAALLLEIERQAERIHRLAATLAAIDVALSLANVAAEFGYVRPIVDDSDQLLVRDGRHPLVERRAGLGRFVPNDVDLRVHEQHLWIISGPNMAGKSTFLRQVALVVILAQMGAYVPAAQARIGVVDRVLSRVGASDNLAGGESTFMVEMRETAAILRGATSRSLVILDEVGRGTSTYDGLSIAWAVAEHLDRVVCCRTLFATHYHELTELPQSSATAANLSVSAREHQGRVVFLHRVVPGAASRSYGIEVARLAGLPELVLSRARSLLGAFEGRAPARALAQQAPLAQLDLFGPKPTDPALLDLRAALRAVDVDRLTGIEALQLLSTWQKAFGKES